MEGKGKQLESDTLQEQQEESWSLIGKDSVPTDQSLTEFGLVQRELSTLFVFVLMLLSFSCCFRFLKKYWFGLVCDERGADTTFVCVCRWNEKTK